MAGWHHWHDARESGWTPGFVDGQGSLECCDPWDRKESNATERLNWTECKCHISIQGSTSPYKKDMPVKPLCVCLLSHVWLFATPWTVACQAPLFILQARILEQVSISSSRGSSWPSQPSCLASPALAGGFFTTVPPSNPPVMPSLIFIYYIFFITGHKPGFAMIFYSN